MSLRLAQDRSHGGRVHDPEISIAMLRIAYAHLTPVLSCARVGPITCAGSALGNRCGRLGSARSKRDQSHMIDEIDVGHLNSLTVDHAGVCASLLVPDEFSYTARSP